QGSGGADQSRRRFCAPGRAVSRAVQDPDTGSDPMSASTAPVPRLSPRAVFFLGLSAGVLTGLIEALVLLSRRLVLGLLAHVSAHFGWMAPVGDLLLFDGPALAFALCARLWPRLGSGRLG